MNISVEAAKIRHMLGYAGLSAEIEERLWDFQFSECQEGGEPFKKPQFEDGIEKYLLLYGARFELIPVLADDGEIDWLLLEATETSVAQNLGKFPTSLCAAMFAAGRAGEVAK